MHALFSIIVMLYFFCLLLRALVEHYVIAVIFMLRYRIETTKLIRTLFSFFYTPAVLAESTAYGSRSARSQLDNQI